MIRKLLSEGHEETYQQVVLYEYQQNQQNFIPPNVTNEAELWKLLPSSKKEKLRGILQKLGKEIKD